MFKQNDPKNVIITLTSVPKFGKSTAAEQAGKTAFIQTEDIGDGIKSFKTPLLKSFKEILSAFAWLGTEKHDFNVVAIDSLDWLEPAIHRQVCEENKVSSMEKIGYGRGYIMALDLWRQYIDCIKYLRDTRNMMIVQNAHTEIKRFENPETDAYDRYQIKLHKGAADLVMESSDIILFGNYYVGVTKSEGGFKKERVRAVGSGERVWYTEERPAFRAGNRFDLPSEIAFDRDGKYWDVIKSYIPYFQTQKGE